MPTTRDVIDDLNVRLHSATRHALGSPLTVYQGQYKKWLQSNSTPTTMIPSVAPTTPPDFHVGGYRGGESNAVINAVIGFNKAATRQFFRIIGRREDNALITLMAFPVEAGQAFAMAQPYQIPTDILWVFINLAVDEQPGTSATPGAWFATVMRSWA